jgi:hypothetical protein
MSNANSLKLKYNSTLQRIRKGETYLDDPNTPLPEKELHIPAFVTLTRQAGVVLRELRQLGVIYTVEEFENGFGGDKVE